VCSHVIETMPPGEVYHTSHKQ